MRSTRTRNGSDNRSRGKKKHSRNLSHGPINLISLNRRKSHNKSANHVRDFTRSLNEMGVTDETTAE